MWPKIPIIPMFESVLKSRREDVQRNLRTIITDKLTAATRKVPAGKVAVRATKIVVNNVSLVILGPAVGFVGLLRAIKEYGRDIEEEDPLAARKLYLTVKLSFALALCPIAVIYCAVCWPQTLYGTFSLKTGRFSDFSGFSRHFKKAQVLFSLLFISGKFWIWEIEEAERLYSSTANSFISVMEKICKKKFKRIPGY